ncbi:hypothetical protein DT673_18095 [Salmonella enterica]|nr:hypothetical protein [Salmonella enterica]EBE3710682.1 hypothetical protein [Salmonella enterica subsp. enterica serovar Muenchen]EBW9332033.1 hypothetical protein [Salmonella enterica subsp. enterica serovar Arechavaleta]ECB3676666.1 hypothetical protein [Salmonella enterica subsp. enterica serovar Newport]ECS6028696.1 hypothetical protein [Salmonella enterica subsp. enterica serovar Saintpaul]ECU8318130.1 hypothetical protein [Salmonella enterica subsp. enterica serovar Thompson]ECU98156
MYSGPQQVKESIDNLHKSTDNMLTALGGCDYKMAIAIIDWMKEMVTANACVLPAKDGTFSSRTCPSFPFNYAR